MHIWWLKRQGGAKLHLPGKWPLTSRALVNSTEEKVWVWLREVFHDHQVMVKTPVLRFTTLRDKDKANASPKAKAENDYWLEHLSGVYTTFSICTAKGKVVGCVDVPGKTPQTSASHELKEGLLSDCGIAYTVVAPSSLPAGSTMRAAFLGEIPAEPVQESQSIQGIDTVFRHDLKSFTIQPVKETKAAPAKAQNNIL
jgi:hypothetical protein